MRSTNHRRSGFVVYADNWARTSHGGGRWAPSLKRAISIAGYIAATSPNDTVRVFPVSAGPTYWPSSGTELMKMKHGRRGLQVQVNQPVMTRYVPAQGMGDTLTDWACSSSTFAQSWRTRLNDGLSAGAIGAIVGSSAAGLIGALIGQPFLGAAVGAAGGWAAYAIWTAPLRP